MLSGILCRAVTCVLRLPRLSSFPASPIPTGLPVVCRTILGFVWPAYMCFKDTENGQKNNHKQWCIYWCARFFEHPNDMPSTLEHSHLTSEFFGCGHLWALWVSLVLLPLPGDQKEKVNQSVAAPSPSHNPRTSSRVKCAGLLLYYTPPWSDSRTCSCSGVLSPCSTYCFDNDWPLLYVASSVGDRCYVHTYFD